MSQAQGPKGLSEVASNDLITLGALLAKGTLHSPLSKLALAHAGLGHLHEHLGPVAVLPTEAILACIHVVLAEREWGKGAGLELVWSGSDSGQSFVQYTGQIIKELIDGAQASVTIAGYSFDHGAVLFEALQRAMTERRIKARFFLDIGQLEARLAQQLRKEHRRVRLTPLRQAQKESPAAYAHAVIDLFRELHLSASGLKPEIFYDPRTADPKSYASMHAKCVIVDHERALITSANFTDRGQSRNIEVGVRIRDAHFAKQLEQQWNNLINSKDVLPA